MGCSQSRLDDEEAVQLCKQRKEFIKQAVEQRTRFASGHIAYIHSLQKVSAALRDYIEEDHEPHEFLDSFKKTFMPNMTVGFVPSSVAMKVNYLRASGNPVISVQERIQSPEIVQVEAYSPINRFGIDGFLAMNSSFFPYHSPNNRPNLPSLSPQASQWDFYWNPFSSLDYHGYPTRSNLDQVAINNEARGEEEIPDLEEDETEPDKFTGKRYLAEERTNFGINSSMGATVVEEDYDNNDDNDEMECPEEGCGSGNLDAPKALTTGHVKPRHKIMAIDDQDGDEETPGFPVYVDRRPTSMAEVIRDLESQFHSACITHRADSAIEQLPQPCKDVESDGRVSLDTEENPRGSHDPPTQNAALNFITRSPQTSPLNLQPRIRTEELASQIRVMDRCSEILRPRAYRLATMVRQIQRSRRCFSSSILQRDPSINWTVRGMVKAVR